MPLYEYQCQACGRRFEIIQKFSDPPLTSCTICGGSVLKLLSTPAIQFKGTGWYITDYARKPGGDGAKAEGSDAKPVDAQGEKPSSEKPASEKSDKSASASSDSKAAKTSTTTSRKTE